MVKLAKFHLILKEIFLKKIIVTEDFLVQFEIFPVRICRTHAKKANKNILKGKNDIAGGRRNRESVKNNI